MDGEPLRVWWPPVGPVDLADRRDRLTLTQIVRAHVDTTLDEATRARRYHGILGRYVRTDPGSAEVALLPRTLEDCDPWVVRETIATAEAAGLRTLAFSARDLEPRVPSPSVILLHPGPTRGAQPGADVLATPYFYGDRAGATPTVRPDPERPSVAFCGQGAVRRAPAAAQALRRAGTVARHRIRPGVVPPPLGGHVGLRAAALHALATDPGVDAHFVIRDRYRAGVADEASRARTQKEFDENLASATYALCVRGTGNFSARFYEALGHGRVPLFVDTDCVLPFEDEIDWRARTVWADRSQVDRLGAVLRAAHPTVRTDPLRSAAGLRRLWEERLTQPGFFGHLPDAVRRRL